jgi:tRNA pseudouridine55 synthase
VVEVLDRFMGPIAQVPPMHSALKKDGKPLYEYARDGQTVEREARQVVIHDLELLDMRLDGDTPCLQLRVRCSKGTYIRTLGEDIGEALGCGGHLTMLRRTATGPFDATQCITLDALASEDEGQRLAHLAPVQVLLEGHVPVTLDADNAGRYLSGVRRRGDWPDQKQVVVFGPAPATSIETSNPSAVLLGSGHTEGGELIPGRLLSPIEIQQILETAT